jgi:ribonuclease P protein component
MFSEPESVAWQTESDTTLSIIFTGSAFVAGSAFRPDSVPLVSALSMTSPSQAAPRQTMAGARLRKHSDYQRAYAAARKRQSASMSWFLAPQTPSGVSDSAYDRVAPRVGLTAGKVLGKAHERNRIKRRMREALRRHIDLLPLGFDLIFHPRRLVLTLEFTKLEAEIVRILEQAKAEAARGTTAVAATRGSSAAPAS